MEAGNRFAALKGTLQSEGAKHGPASPDAKAEARGGGGAAGGGAASPARPPASFPPALTLKITLTMWIPKEQVDGALRAQETWHNRPGNDWMNWLLGVTMELPVRSRAPPPPCLSTHCRPQPALQPLCAPCSG